MTQHTEGELALLALALEGGDQGSCGPKFWEQLTVCRKERLDREQPEWREQMRAAYKLQRRAIDDYSRWMKVIVDRFGAEELYRVQERLEKGDLP